MYKAPLVLFPFLDPDWVPKFCPKWLGDRVDLITVGGDKSREDTMWRDSENEVFAIDLRKIVAAVLEVAVHIVMSTHIYEFCGRYFIQRDGAFKYLGHHVGSLK